MGAEHFPRGAVHHQLHQHLLVAARQRVPHRTEGGTINLDVREALDRLILGQADRADLRLREHGRRNGVVVGRRRVVLEGGLDEAHRFVDGHRRQLHAVGDVADRPDVLDIGAGISVDDDGTRLAKFHADAFEPHILGIRDATDGQHDLVDGQRLAAGKQHVQPALRVLAHPFGNRVAEDPDSLFLHRLVQSPAKVHVEPAEDLLAAIDQRGLHAQPMEDVGELDGDVASALDHDRLRQLLEIEGLVGEDAVLMAGERRMRRRPAARGDQDLVGADDAVLCNQINGMRIDQHGTRVEGLAAHALDIALVDRLQPGDLLVLVGNQRRPVEACLGHPPAIAGRIGEMFGKLRGIDIELLRHAAADDAGAAVAILLGDGDAPAEGCRHTGRPHPAGAAADDEEIIVVTGHRTGSC